MNFGDVVITDELVNGFLTKSKEYSTGTLLMSLEPMTLDNEHWDWIENNQ